VLNLGKFKVGSVEYFNHFINIFNINRTVFNYAGQLMTSHILLHQYIIIIG
jgi:hypothetical protein